MALLEDALGVGHSGGEVVHMAVEAHDIGVTNSGAVGDHPCIDARPVEGSRRAEPLIEKPIVGSE